MRSALKNAAQARVGRRSRSTSLSTVPPAEGTSEYIPGLAAVAASIIYRSPLPSREGRPIYIINAAAFPDAFEVDYNTLLSYVLARLPGEDELLSGTEYEIVFFAGGQPEGATTEKKQGPGMGWYLQAYHVLSRATRKKLKRLYIVHPSTWVRVLVGVFGTVVSPKFRRKIIHVNTLSALALHIPMEKLLIPPSVYLRDRMLSPDIYVPFATGRRAFGVKHPFPKNIDTGETRLPRVLRETTSFILSPSNITTEGLFRIPPHSTLAGALKEAYDRGQYWVVWKERGAPVVQPGIDPALVDEVRLEDAYGIHLAASLIKQWYRDLRDPIIPQSSYPALKERFGAPDAAIKPEDLVDLMLPQSNDSLLSKNSRQTITSHLLPMLSEVASFESKNKMTPENLGICFSMCLVCGSDQLEDAKMASIVKRILQAAIEMWPELRTGMNISPDTLYLQLEAPADLRDYEDPLEEETQPRQQPRMSEDDVIETREGHRIVLDDSEAGVVPGRAPTLPPRPGSSRDLQQKAAPPLPGRQLPASDVSPTWAGAGLPKRKPAPPTVEPPRYSSVFDLDGNSLNVADSPASYVPADGFGPRRRGPWSYDESEKKGFTPPGFETPADQHAVLNVPKRKAVSGEQDTSAMTSSTTADARSASDGDTLARQAADRAATILAQQLDAALTTPNETPNVAQSPDSIVVSPPESALPEGNDAVFRIPTWPASARPQGLSKPVLPPRYSQTMPVPNGSAPSSIPRTRGPSPGLLKRISSMEVSGAQEGSNSLLEAPRRLNLRKQSVEDLRRLYEERASTVQGLAQADFYRRKSTPK